MTLQEAKSKIWRSIEKRTGEFSELENWYWNPMRSLSGINDAVVIAAKKLTAQVN